MIQDSTEYLEFLQKFETKKTTDDCFTPPAVYDAVRDWVTNEYQLEGCNILRPFVPDGDYLAVEYGENDVVIDNPPFSIATQIVRFYESIGVRYFIFANQLTLLSSDAACSVVTDETITYTNGAKINTSFLTNMDGNKIRTAPKLKAAIAEADKQSRSQKAKLPKYIYPDNAVTAAMLGKVSAVDFAVPRSESTNKLNRLDSQKDAKKTLFGGGLLISDKAAAELKAAELKATVEAIEWELSERELDVISKLS